MSQGIGEVILHCSHPIFVRIVKKDQSTAALDQEGLGHDGSTEAAYERQRRIEVFHSNRAFKATRARSTERLPPLLQRLLQASINGAPVRMK